MRLPIVLLAEDDDAMRTLLHAILTEQGWWVVSARGGSEALEYLAMAQRPASGHPRPDVVISDIRMPRFGGFDLLCAVRQMERGPPVLLLTAFGDRRVHDRALREGAMAVFDKPFHFEDLVRAAESALQYTRA